MIFSFFGSYAYIYSTIYHFNARQIGLCYIPVIVGKAISPNDNHLPWLVIDNSQDSFWQ